MSAATDAIGRCVFIGTLYELEVPSRDCHVASLLAMTRQGSAAMGTVRRTESAVLLPLRGRAGHAPPLQGQCGLNGGRCESAVPSRDCHVASLLAMTRQGSAAMGTVRRTESAVLLPLRGRAGHAPPLQGQCGLNGGRCESAVPSRDCHVASLLAMTRQGSAAMGTVRRTESAVLLPLRGRAWLSPPLQGQCGLNGGRRMIHSSFFSIHYSLFHPSPCGGWQTI